jgi:cytochrome c551
MRNRYLLLVIMVWACLGCVNKDKMYFKQYMTNGEKLYNVHCGNCHQPDGSGLGNLIPPLSNDFSIKNKSLVVCAIRNGLSGPIQISGKTFDGKMPSNPQLSSLEIAEIMTYITNSWENSSDRTTISEVDSLLMLCQ